MNLRTIFALFSAFAIFAIAPSALAQKKPPRVQPTPERSVDGKLLIASDPAGASVYINNRFIDKTNGSGNLEIALKPGRYALKVEHPEYKPFFQSISIRAGDPNLIRATLAAKYGYLLLANAPREAKIELDEKALSESDLERESETEIRIKTSIGEHSLRVALPGYAPFNRSVNIIGANPETVTVAMERLRATMAVKSEPGTRVYINGEAAGIVPSTKQLIVNSLISGDVYNILIERDGYEKYETRAVADADKEIALAPVLRPLPASAEFVDNFENGLKFWNAPAQWKTEGQLLQVKGEGTLGLPKEKWYCDAEALFGFRLETARGAAWILRAQNEKNFYLFRLSGPEGRMPNKFLTYVCRDGVINLDEPAIIPLPIPELRIGESYRIRIKITGNVIQHWITPTNQGKEVSIGLFEDQQKNFSCGNIGFASPDGEEFLVHGFIITPINR